MTPLGTTAARIEGSHDSSGIVVEGGTTTEGAATNPDDYLESSAELLRSLAAEEERAKAIAAETETHASSWRALWASVFTPLGIGSILLMILSSATLGYLILRPATMEWLSTWVTSSDPATNGLGSIDAPPSGLSNLAPDLAAGEFDPIRANNLSSLPAGVGLEETATAGVEDDLLDDDAAIAENNLAQNNWTPPAVTAPSPAPAPNARSNNAIAPPSPAPVAAPRPAIAPAPTPPSPVSRPIPVVPMVTPTAAPSSPSPQPVVDLSTSDTSSSTEAEAPSLSLPSASDLLDSAVSDISDTNEMANEMANGDESGGEEAIAPSPDIPSRSTPTPDSIAVIEPVLPSGFANSGSANSGSASSGSASSESTGPTVAPTSSTPISADLYYVTTPYTGDQSLESAQGAVSGSYVRSFPSGTQVQMGAFSNESGAEEFIQNLENQGISAEIYEGDEEN
ncbi:MAG: SPOR domain-containing protein [Cyanothece sp. SIO2G6]|nr:SPOR domain-containing protein [Cyanothece sp. SIO2G6]